MMAAAYAIWVPTEEQHLRELYGPTYDDYRRDTNRWWGRSKPRNLVFESLSRVGAMPTFGNCRAPRR